ncbi:hypothetical protein HGM15179_019065, partial [Zosterops borbonicus]
IWIWERLVMILRDVRIWEGLADGDDPGDMRVLEEQEMDDPGDVRIWEELVDKYDPGNVDLERAGGR